MSGARLVFSIGGTTTELAGAVGSAKSMLSDLAKTAAQSSNPGRSSGIKSAIDEQRKQLSLMKGTYDEVTAKAIEFRRKGAPQELISQYVALRREILATAAAEKAAADQAAARAAQNASYAASQERLATARSAARSQAMNPMAGGKGGGGMGGMGPMMLPMMANSLAVGFQDAVSVYQTNGSALSAISAAGNNIIFLLTLLNPMAGALGAITIGLTQLGIAWLNSGDNAEASAERQKEAADKITNALKEQADLRDKLAEGDVKGIDSEVDTLAKDVKRKEREHAFLTKQIDDTYKARDNGSMPFAKANEQIDAAETRREELVGELNTLRPQLEFAKSIQSQITPWQRKVEDAKDGKFDGGLNELKRMRDETAILTGKETELGQKQKDWRSQGLSPQLVNDLSAEFEKNKAAKAEAAAAKESEAAAEKAKREAEQAEQKKAAEGQAVREKNRNPWEVAQDEAKRVYGLFQDGHITEREMVKAGDGIRKERDQKLMKDMPDRVSHAQSLVRGSVEAARVASTGRRDEKLENIAQQQLAVQKDLLRATERARNPLSKRPPLKEGK